MKLYAISDVHGCFSIEDMDFMDKLFDNLNEESKKKLLAKTGVDCDKE